MQRERGDFWIEYKCVSLVGRLTNADEPRAPMLAGHFPDTVSIRLPRGGTASFPLALAEFGEDRTRAGIVKDAGDDPDVTHGALVVAEGMWAAAGRTWGLPPARGLARPPRPGLPLAVGERAINRSREANGSPKDHECPARQFSAVSRSSARQGSWCPIPVPLDPLDPSPD
jgi:CbiD